MTNEPYVTRRELGILKDQADRERARLRKQMQRLEKTVAASMAKLETNVKTELDKHQREHERDEARRVSSRRWLIGSIIAAVAAIDGPIVTVVLARR